MNTKLIEIKILESKLYLLSGQIEKSKNILDEALDISDNKGLDYLKEKINAEKDSNVQSQTKWINFYQENYLNLMINF